MCALILSGQKTQTRRLVKKGDSLRPNDLYTEYSWPLEPAVFRNGRKKWMVGISYAIQPGRGKKAVGRIRVTEIRRERLQEISEEDVIAEGVYRHSDHCAWTYTYLGKEGPHFFGRAVWAFFDLWDSIHTKPGTRWADDPEVWVLTFELALRAA